MPSHHRIVFPLLCTVCSSHPSITQPSRPSVRPSVCLVPSSFDHFTPHALVHVTRHTHSSLVYSARPSVRPRFIAAPAQRQRSASGVCRLPSIDHSMSIGLHSTPLRLLPVRAASPLRSVYVLARSLELSGKPVFPLLHVLVGMV